MYLTGVYVKCPSPAESDTRLCVTTYGRTVRTFDQPVHKGASLLRFDFPAPIELTDDSGVEMKIYQLRRLRKPRILLQKSYSVQSILTRTYSNNSIIFTREKLSWEFQFQLTNENLGALDELIQASVALSDGLTSVLDHLGRGKQVLATATQIAQVLGELHPIAKTVMGFVVLVHKYMQDQDECDEKVRELAQDMAMMFQYVDRIRELAILRELVMAISSGESLIKETTNYIVDYCQRRTKGPLQASGAPSEKKVVEDLIKQFQRFQAQFDRGIAVQTASTVYQLSQTLPERPPALEKRLFDARSHAILPPKPFMMLGREEDREQLVQQLAMDHSSRIAIIGGGGMGKTTLALIILHDPRIKQLYPSIFFVCCDRVNSAEHLLAELAGALGIPAEQRDSFLLNAILDVLRTDRAILCLDNFETPWEVLDGRSDVERVLVQLAAVDHAAIIVTLRGTQRPAAAAIRWCKHPSPLSPLSFQDACSVFEQLADIPLDINAENLIRAVDCIPLAVTLLATLAQEGTGDTPQSLWIRWGHDHTAMIENGGIDRTSKLDISISLSVHCPRMKSDLSAVDVLAVLSLLPDGFSTSDVSIKMLQDRLPSRINVRSAFTTLRRTALVQQIAVVPSEEPWLNLLSPIREWAKVHLTLPKDIWQAVVLYYTDLLRMHEDISFPSNRLLAASNFANCRDLLAFAYTKKHTGRDIITSTVIYTQWSLVFGCAAEELLLRALSTGPLTDLHALCLFTLAEVYIRQDRLDLCERPLQHALQLHTTISDPRGAGKDLRLLAYLFVRLNRFKEAEDMLNRAIEIHKTAQDELGKATSLMTLGQLYMRQDRLDDAERTLQEALELHHKNRSYLGEGNDLLNLAKVHLRQERLSHAETALRRALPLHRQANSQLGEADDMHNIAELHLRRNELNEAQDALNRAMELHKEGHSSLGEGNDLQLQMELHLRRGNLGDAVETLRRASTLHRQARDVLGEANDQLLLGEVLVEMNRFEDGLASLEKAKELHEQCEDTLACTRDVDAIVRLLNRQTDRGDDATFEEASSLRFMGNLHMQQAHLDESAWGTVAK